MNDSQTAPPGDLPAAVHRELTDDEKNRLQQVKTACAVLNDAITEHFEHVPRFNLQQLVMQELDGMGKLLYGVEDGVGAVSDDDEPAVLGAGVGQGGEPPSHTQPVRVGDDIEPNAPKVGSEWLLMWPKPEDPDVPVQQRVRVEGVAAAGVSCLILGTEIHPYFKSINEFLERAIPALD